MRWMPKFRAVLCAVLAGALTAAGQRIAVDRCPCQEVSPSTSLLDDPENVLLPRLPVPKEVQDFNPLAALPAKPAVIDRGNIGPMPRVVGEQTAANSGHGKKTGRTPNFIAVAGSQREAEEYAQAAEQARKSIAVSWLGRPLPDWREPCRIDFDERDNEVGGATTMDFEGDRLVGLKIQVTGNREWFLTIGIPHEVSHAVFATHFRRPIPKWADEGGAQMAESDEEQKRHHKILIRILNDGHGLKLSYLFRLMNYPVDKTGRMALYAQGHSVTRWIVGAQGRQQFLAFVDTGQRTGWDSAAKSIGFAGVDDLEEKWLAWLKDGAKLASNACKCGPSCPGESCACGCRHTVSSENETNYYWWIVPAAVAAGSAIKFRGDRGHAAV